MRAHGRDEHGSCLCMKYRLSKVKAPEEQEGQQGEFERRGAVLSSRIALEAVTVRYITTCTRLADCAGAAVMASVSMRRTAV